MSPRGPVEIDPTTRDVIQNVYIRKIETIDGQLAMPTIATILHVKNSWEVGASN
jgi:branched-chain amino acid transport system substrate-binding protein